MPPDIPYSTTLADERLLLRSITEDDIPALCDAIEESKEPLIRWMAWCTPAYGPTDAEAFVRPQPEAWREGREYGFLILDRQTGKVLGNCGLNRIDWLNLYGNLGYWVRTSAAGAGVATAAARLVLRFALEQLGLMRVEIVAAVGNTASQRVAEKVGATREGRARNRCRAGGVQHDAYVYSVTPGEKSECRNQNDETNPNDE
jgi:RimJ/RimL family protein N-acetyltransferase